MMLIGVTGNIASGKTTVCRVFEKQGAYALSGDEIGKYVAERNPEVLGKLVSAFGSHILKPDGSLDRRKLGRIVFSDSKKRKMLDSVVHPPLLSELRKRIDSISKSDPLLPIVVDAALIVEWNISDWFDELVVVVCDEGEQLRRLVEKGGFPVEEAKDRIASQIPVERKISVADYVIRNDSDVGSLEEKALEVWHSIIEKHEAERS